MQLLLAVKFLGTIQSWLYFLFYPFWSSSGNTDCRICRSAAPVCPFSVAWGGNPGHSGCSGNAMAMCKRPGAVNMSWLCSGNLRDSVWLAVTYSLCFQTPQYHKIRRKFVLMTQPLQWLQPWHSDYFLLIWFYFSVSKVLGLGFIAVSLRTGDSAVYWPCHF